MIGRLSRLGKTVKHRASFGWQAAGAKAERARQWLTPKRWMVFWTAAIGTAVLLITILPVGGLVWLWTKYTAYYAAVAPLLTLVAGVAVAGVALLRHFAQTDADRQRRITESFSKAIEQLGSEKVEVHLGGIYSLERISRESPDDYWTVIENLTAFVRERSHRTEVERTERVSQRAYFLWLEAGRPEGGAECFWAKAIEWEDFGGRAPVDIAAVMTVLKRRNERGRRGEIVKGWCLDLSGAILRSVDLEGANLDRADFSQTNLERANLPLANLQGAILSSATLEGANLSSATLEGANLSSANLKGANLSSADLQGAVLDAANLLGASLKSANLEGAHLYDAHLERVDLTSANLRETVLVRANLTRAFLAYANLERAHLASANLQGAILLRANLEEADLYEAHLEGANLRESLHLSEARLIAAFGDRLTRLPDEKGIARPAHWQGRNVLVERPQAEGT